MPLTVRSNGTGGGIVSAAWWNDYYNLLTGAMNDQAVALNYRPGSANGLATLTLKGDGNNPLLLGYDTDNTTVTTTLDHSGNLTLSGNINTPATLNAIPAALPGATTSYLIVRVSGNASGRASLGLRADGSGNLRLGKNGTSYATELYTDGSQLVIGSNLTVTGGVITGANGASITVGNGSSDVLLSPAAGHWTYLNSTASFSSFVDNVGTLTINGINVSGVLQDASNNRYVKIRSAGGGAAGTTIWVGTTAPGAAAAEGDIWIKA